MAFGRVGKRYVSLNAGLVMKFYTDRPTFRAVVLHELAHLRNADLDKTYFSVAVGAAFAIVALVPFAGSLVYYLIGSGDPGGPTFVLGVTWRVLALAALVYLTLAAVLRVREVYADVRASVWDGPSGGLPRVLGARPRNESGWGTLLRFHPDPERRRQTITETDDLFRLGFWDALATGVTAMIAIPMAHFVLILPIPSHLENWTSVVTILLAAPLAMGVVALGAWRGAFAALARGEASRGAGELGLGLGLGVVAGATLSLDTSLAGASIEAELGMADAGSTIASLALDFLFAALLLVGLFCFMKWVSTGASVWLETVTTRRSLRLVVSLGLLVASLLSAVWLGPLLWLFITIGPAPLQSFAVVAAFTPTLLSAIFGVIVYALYSPLTLLALTGLWAFPLSANFRHRPTFPGSTARWAWLDPQHQAPMLGCRDDFRLPRALLVGTIAGLAFCALLLIARFGWRNSIPEAVRSTDQMIVYFLRVRSWWQYWCRPSRPPSRRFG